MLTLRHVERLAVSAFALLLAIRFDHPLWFDEYGQFVFGAYENSGDFWAMFFKTIQTQHNQTGVHYYINFLSLRFWGAGLHVMRYPGYCSGFLLFWSSHFFLSNQKMPQVVRVMAPVLLAISAPITEHLSEARAYILLAGASMATLAGFLVTRAAQNREAAILRSVGVVSGCLFHPYFPLYWVMAGALGILYRRERRDMQLDLGSLIKHAGPLLTVVGAVLYLVPGAFTWIGHQGEFQFRMNPFQFLPAPLLPLILAGAHVPLLNPWLGTLLLLVTLAAGVLPAQRLPAILMVSGLFASGLLIAASYAKSYWILDRQWLGSIPWTAMAAAWVAGNALNYLLERYSPTSLIQAVTLVLLLALVGRPVWKRAAAQWHDWRHRPVLTALQQSLQKTNRDELPEDTNARTALATLNCIEGGPVWPVFRKHYGEP